MAFALIPVMIPVMITGMNSVYAQQSASTAAGPAQSVNKDPSEPPGKPRAGGSGDLLMDMGTLVLLGVLVGAIVLVRRWLTLRSRKPLPGLPRERILPLSRHGTLHDPKYLGRILEVDEPPPGP